MVAVFTGIVAFFKAIPVLDSWLQLFIVWFNENKLASMTAENRDAVIKAAKTYDQRPIEAIIESPTAGQPSGVPGSTIVSGPPPRN